MCVIVDRPAGVDLPPEILEAAMMENPDGWGIMFSAFGELHTWKGLDPDNFWAHHECLGDPTFHVTYHFRWRTHGDVSTDNCHPYVIGDDYAVVHNGVIAIPTRNKVRSDTWHYVEDVLAPILAKYGSSFGEAVLGSYLEQTVGRHNKLVILRRDGARMFLHEGAGVEHNGLWLSNSGPLWAVEEDHDDLWDDINEVNTDLDDDWRTWKWSDDDICFDSKPLRRASRR